MKTKFTLSIFLVFMSISTMLFGQSSILVLNSTTDIVTELSATDGSVINSSFINMSSMSPGTIKGITQVGEKIWISDQTQDKIFVYSLTGIYESQITGNMDNIRGLNMVNGEVWVTNAGSSNGATANSVVRFSTDGAFLGNYPTIGSPFDVLDFGDGTALITSFNSDGIQKKSYDNSSNTSFVGSGVLSGLEQINFDLDGNLLVAAFSSNASNAAGYYRLNTSGSIINSWPFSSSSVRGIIALENGKILVSTSVAVYVLDPANGSFTSVISGNYQFFTKIDATLGVAESSKAKVSIYPVPATDFVNLNSDKKIANATIISMDGKSVKSVALNQNSGRIEVSSLTSGVYLISVKMTDGTAQILKFTKK